VDRRDRPAGIRTEAIDRPNDRRGDLN